ncbi:MAG: hypothetical protein NC041_07700 [Bacteroides sp.]|nr:hypothetical protein [Prevotella sp.]MCM1407184.1 hypothetical protein [Treponema brennaborense]MCM1470336.1 hypothetical protein [Bacteroides sp.]
MKHEILFYTDGIWIKDALGRRRIFRGCSLDSGSAYFQPEKTEQAQNVQDGRIPLPANRFFSEQETDEYFSRLAAAGCTFIRWNITWEQIEHSGPEIYDEEFLACLRRVLKKAEQYGIFVCITPCLHRWSRFTGGYGAPEWTLHAADFNAQHSAPISGQSGKPQIGTIMTALFFAGNTIAPELKADGEPLQNYLQNHYIAAMRHTARRLKDCRAVIACGIMENFGSAYTDADDISAEKNETEIAGSGYVHFLKKLANICETPSDFYKDFVQPFQKRYISEMQIKHGHLLFFVNGSSDNFLSYWEHEKEPHNLIGVLNCGGITGKSAVSSEQNSKNGGKKTADGTHTFAETAAAAGIPLFLDTAHKTNSAEKASACCSAAAKEQHVFADAHLLSAAAGDFSAKNALASAGSKNEKCMQELCRPYAVATAGIPVRMQFYEQTRENPAVFEYEWDAEPCGADNADCMTELYIPDVHFPPERKIDFIAGSGTVSQNSGQQRLYIKTAKNERCAIRITAGKQTI